MAQRRHVATAVAAQNSVVYGLTPRCMVLVASCSRRQHAQGRHQVKKCGVDKHGEHAEREPITGYGSGANSGVKGQSPWLGGQEGKAPPP